MFYFHDCRSLSTPTVLKKNPVFFSFPNVSYLESRRKLSHSLTFFTASSEVSYNHTVLRSISTITMSPPGILENFSYKLTPDEFLKKADGLITDCKKLYDQVAGVQDIYVSYDTVLKILNEAENLVAARHFFLEFAQYVSPDSDIRAASTEADRRVREFCVESSMRKDIFQKLLVLEKKEEPMKPIAKRYLRKLIQTGKRNGLHLDDNTQKQVKKIKNKINNLSIDFTKNLNDVTTTLEFSKEELNGLPDDFFDNLKIMPESGKYEITLKYPHYCPIMEKCKVPETRKKMDFAYNTQCIEENGRILTELRKIRHELAVLLGYPNHAAYKTEVLMSKNPQNVSDFLTNLAEKMKPLWQEEKKYFLELKEKECAELGVPYDGKLNNWDKAYYDTKAKEIKYAVDKDKLREYFPIPVVKAGLFEIYQDLLGLKFDAVEGDIWHEDVELYSVTDSSSGKLLGYFYLDLYPRPNKYFHAAAFEMQQPLELPDGTRQVCVRAMVANFPKPQKDTPSLLDHNEVTTFFHEFGHLMHYISMEMEFAYYSTLKMERDFTEAPSQMLENWCWEKEPLRKMSSHYKDKSEIPDDILNALVKSRTANVGHFNCRQILLATYDQRIHSSPEGDTKELFYELSRKIVGIEPQAGTDFPCHFNHLANEYDAQYYGYLWSEVYSMDMFCTRFGSENVLNPVVGKDYRDKILKPGGAQDAYDLVCNFLGRKPNQEAFLRSKGLEV